MNPVTGQCECNAGLSMYKGECIEDASKKCESDEQAVKGSCWKNVDCDPAQPE
jgi:hypothetical protein